MDVLGIWDCQVILYKQSGSKEQEIIVFRKFLVLTQSGTLAMNDAAHVRMSLLNIINSFKIISHRYAQIILLYSRQHKIHVQFQPSVLNIYFKYLFVNQVPISHFIKNRDQSFKLCIFKCFSILEDLFILCLK